MESTHQTLYQNNVELYDIAFDWDTNAEVAWLINRLGSHCHTLLEPGCGSGRVLEAFAKNGFEIVGLDKSAEGIAFAQKRVANFHKASALLGDMTNFDLKRSFDGAICPINTLAILSPLELKEHLASMARHLARGARYLVQVALRSPLEESSLEAIEWTAQRNDINLRIRVWIADTDPKKMRELHGFKIIVESGRRVGEIIEERHWMTRWTPDSWQKIISESPFALSAQYDGDLSSWPLVPLGSVGNLMWHELARK